MARPLEAYGREGRRVRLTLRRAALAVGIVALTAGCSTDTQWGRWGLPERITEQAKHIGDLWNGAWTASMLIGVLVWGLMGYAAIRFRRKRHGDKPRQNTYNLPLEIMYTIVPVLIIGVLFFFTVRAQDAVVVPDSSSPPQHTIRVVGQKWSWTFNYMEQNNSKVGAVVHDVGTIENFPDLYLPLNQKVRFELESADVIHSFWVPEFYFKLDVIPGRTNAFEVTPTKEGEFLGKCAELCGSYHSAMLFNVHVVSEEKYLEHLNQLKSQGQTGEIKVPAYITSVPVPSAKESQR